MNLKGRLIRAVDERWHATVLPRLTGERTFTFDGAELPYCLGPLSAWRSERAVEVPIGFDWLDRQQGRVLEVGNVLGRYKPCTHTVVDKYDTSPGLLNEDVIDHEGRYDAIVAISTIEHVGYDETPREPDKAARAIGHLLELLEPDGSLLITIPLAYNRDLDDTITANPWGLRLSYVRRMTSQTWRQVDDVELRGLMYGWPHRAAQAIAILRR